KVRHLSRCGGVSTQRLYKGRTERGGQVQIVVRRHLSRLEGIGGVALHDCRAIAENLLDTAGQLFELTVGLYGLGGYSHNACSGCDKCRSDTLCDCTKR